MDSGQGSLGGYPEPGLSTPPGNSSRTWTSHNLQRTWRPARGAGQLIGAVLVVGALAFTIFTIQAATGTGGFGRVVLLLLAVLGCGGAALAGFLLVRLRSMRYTLGADALTISAVGTHIEIPYREITGIIFRPRDVIELGGYERYWPGFYDSVMITPDGPWRSLATTPARERVRILGPGGGILAISPARPVLFVEALEFVRDSAGHAPAPYWPSAADEPPPTPPGLPAEPARIATLPAAPGAQPRPEAAPAPRSFRRPTIPVPAVYRIFVARIVRGDPVASKLLAASLLVLIALVFMAAWKVDAVTRPLAVKWNPDGEPSWFVRSDGIWLIDGVWIYPVTVAAIVVVNAALATLAAAFDRLVEARLLLSTAVVVGCLMLLAMVRTTGLF